MRPAKLRSDGVHAIVDATHSDAHTPCVGGRRTAGPSATALRSPESKRCPSCGETKPLDEFAAATTKGSRRFWRCRSCDAQAHKAKNVAGSRPGQWVQLYGPVLDPDCITIGQRSPEATPAVEPTGARPVPSDLLGLLRLPDWWDRANCLGMEPSAFHPGPGKDAIQAREVCAGCTVRVECLERALTIRASLGRDSDVGVWGGTTERERKALAAERRKAVA